MPQNEQGQKVYSDAELAETIDSVLPKMDTDQDGFVSFAEYVIAYTNHEKEENTAKP